MSATRDRAYSDDRLLNLSLEEIKALRQKSSRRSTSTRPPAFASQVRPDALPLSFAQERLWFFDQLGTVGATYNMPMALRLRGQLDIAALEHSLTELTCRHEILRTRFFSVAGTPTQVIDAPSAFVMPVRDLSALPPAQKEQEASEQQREETDRPFDLARGPLLRACLLKLADQDHLLLLTLHHIIADGWSLSIVQRELSALYRGHRDKTPVSLPQITAQYADYALWQRRWLEGEIVQRQLRYWTEQLDAAPPQLLLPTDRPRPAAESFKGATHRFSLPAMLVRSLKDLASHEQATTFMVLLAAYQVLLSRWSGQQDVIVGSPIAGRASREMEDLIGCFLNTLPLRTHVDEQLSFRQLLARVKGTTLDAYAHQDLPFEILVKELRPDRDLARQPVFQVMMVLQNYPQEEFQLSGLSWEWADVARGITHFDLSLMLYETADELYGTFEYATDLFDAATIVRMTEQFRTLLEGITSDPDCEVWRLPLLSAAEWTRIVREWNATDTDHSHDALVHELFEQHAQRTPRATAVIFEGVTLTYAELNARANRLARYLCAQGVTVGECIPILIPRSLDMLLAQLAVLKSGGVYVPIDPSTPVDRQTFILKDCNARRIIINSPACAEIKQHFGEEAVHWIDCAATRHAVELLPGSNLGLRLGRPAAAYVMYTSGTTGVPKGVIITHHGINRLIINNGYARFEAADRFAHCSNPAFDASTFEVWGALLHGAALIIVPYDKVVAPEQLGKVLHEHHVTVLFQTTALFNQYAAMAPEKFPTLRYVFFGGETADPKAVAKVLDERRCQHLLNAYGPTETTTFATCYLCDNVSQETTSIPIGRPISNTQIYVLDAHCQPVPVGIAGEIYIGGAGVALGYLSRPELTAERFVPDPFSTDPHARLYRSGDFGRWRADGQLEFVGRNDQQVKIRGFRIELGEIEVQLARHPDIKESAVVARDDGSGGKRLVAYVAPQSSSSAAGTLSADALREFLKRTLPEYMIPTAFVVLERLPLNTSGKLDRRALPTPEFGALSRREYEPPVGEVEEGLAKIWAGLLGVARVGRHDNFFELGGHSLLAVKLVVPITQRLGVNLAVTTVFRCPTVQQMAEVLELLRQPTTAATTDGVELEEGTI